MVSSSVFHLLLLQSPPPVPPWDHSSPTLRPVPPCPAAAAAGRAHSFGSHLWWGAALALSPVISMHCSQQEALVNCRASRLLLVNRVRAGDWRKGPRAMWAVNPSGPALVCFAAPHHHHITPKSVWPLPACSGFQSRAALSAFSLVPQFASIAALLPADPQGRTSLRAANGGHSRHRRSPAQGPLHTLHVGARCTPLSFSFITARYQESLVGFPRLPTPPGLAPAAPPLLPAGRPAGLLACGSAGAFCPIPWRVR